MAVFGISINRIKITCSGTCSRQDLVEISADVDMLKS